MSYDVYWKNSYYLLVIHEPLTDKVFLVRVHWGRVQSHSPVRSETINKGRCVEQAQHQQLQHHNRNHHNKNNNSNNFRELKQRRRRRRGRRLVKNDFIFYSQNWRLSRSVRFANGSKIVLKLNIQRRRSIRNGNTKNKPTPFTFCRLHRTWSFRVVVLQRTAKKCTKSYIARALLLFCSLNRLFFDVLVAVVVVA